MRTCRSAGIPEWHVFSWKSDRMYIAGGDLAEAVNEGVRRGYDKGYLRKSVVKDPVRRGNTGDNTPGYALHRDRSGDQIKVTVGPKGFRKRKYEYDPYVSNRPQVFRESRISSWKLLRQQARTPCPPMVASALVSAEPSINVHCLRKSTDAPDRFREPGSVLRRSGKEMLEKVNKLGIGPQGFGGKPQPSASISRQCRLILRECHAQSTSTAMLPVIKRR